MHKGFYKNISQNTIKRIIQFDKVFVIFKLKTNIKTIKVTIKFSLVKLKKKNELILNIKTENHRYYLFVYI